MTQKQIILASASPRRKQIMEELGLSFTIVPSEYEEIHAGYTDPYELAQEFAREKARDVFQKHPDAIVIGSDTTVVDPQGRLLGKAKDRAEAFHMMKTLQGLWSGVVTGLTVLDRDSEMTGYDEVRVLFKPMSDADIDQYLDDQEADWHDKAGAYAIQGKARPWIETLEGEWTTIVGLPAPLLVQFLQKRGILVEK